VVAVVPVLSANGPAAPVVPPPPATPKCVASTQYYDGNTGGSVSVCTKWSPSKPCFRWFMVGFYNGVTGKNVSVCRSDILSKIY